MEYFDSARYSCDWLLPHFAKNPFTSHSANGINHFHEFVGAGMLAWK
jgi:hypothetical protein